MSRTFAERGPEGRADLGVEMGLDMSPGMLVLRT